MRGVEKLSGIVSIVPFGETMTIDIVNVFAQFTDAMRGKINEL